MLRYKRDTVHKRETQHQFNSHEVAYETDYKFTNCIRLQQIQINNKI